MPSAQEVGVQGEGPVQRLRISGIVRFGSVSTIGGATLAGFDLPTAQRIFHKQGKLDEIALAAASGVSETKLVEDVKKILPPTAEIRLASEQAEEDASETDQFLSVFRIFLLVFAGVALFVGSFVIANSLAITIAQRTREFATIRTLGASRRQVLGSIVLESLVVGTLASLVGLVFGLGLAKFLFWLFEKVGFTLPNQGLLLETRTIVLSLLVGILVTLVASLRPAVRATRVPPIAAVREGATLPESRFARFRTPGSLALVAVGLAALLRALFGSDQSTKSVFIWLGIGAVLIFLGVALFAARISRPLATLVSPFGTWTVVALSVLFWPFWTLPFWLLRVGAFGPGGAGRRVLFGLVGLVLNPFLALIVLVLWVRASLTRWEPEWPLDFPGVLPDRTMNRLATQNARRNPQRTASTAAALMIGLALVTLVATLAAGLTSTFRGAVNDLFTSDYAITAQNNFSPIPVAVAQAAAKAPGVEAIASTRTGEARVFDKTEFVTAVDPQADQVLTLTWTEGSQQTLSTLGADGAFVDNDYAKSHDLRVGSPITIQVPSGKKLQLKVNGIFDPPTGGSPFGHVTFSSATFDREYEAPKNIYTFILMHGGETAQNTAALETDAGGLPEREGPDARGVHRQPDQRAQPGPEHPLRAAGALSHGELLRNRQYARADRVRADAGARNAPGGRYDPAAGPADDPARERDHRADRGRARDRRRRGARCVADRPDRLHRLRAAGAPDPHLCGRGHRRRDPGRHLPGTTRGQARSARSPPVRVASTRARHALRRRPPRRASERARDARA